MMRGTIWTILDGIPIQRDIITLPVNTAFDFEVEATRTKYLSGKPDAGCYLEFGPIAPPWGKL